MSDCCAVQIPVLTGPLGPPGPTGPFPSIANTDTIDLSISGGILTANIDLKSSIQAVKNLTTQNTNYFPKVTNENILALYPGNKVTNFDTVTGTGAYATPSDFNATTGAWTVPANGHYLLSSIMGYRLNNSLASKTSDNPNSFGLPWSTGTTDIGFLGVGFIENATGSIIGCESKIASQKIGSVVHCFEAGLYYFTAGQVIYLCFNNYTDLDMYGQPSSSILWRILKIGL